MTPFLMRYTGKAAPTNGINAQREGKSTSPDDFEFSQGLLRVANQSGPKPRPEGVQSGVVSAIRKHDEDAGLERSLGSLATLELNFLGPPCGDRKVLAKALDRQH